MTAPISQTAFLGSRNNFVGGALAHLRLATRLPLRVSGQCRAHWDDAALDQLRFDREVDLGTFCDLAVAMAKAATTVAPGLIAAGRDRICGWCRSSSRSSMPTTASFWPVRCRRA
ncbi:MAG: hypothetical protein HC844_00525 [Tabrizicola sp.]|nr:hypothetical protein [Tabrizicola sp.]